MYKSAKRATSQAAPCAVPAAAPRPAQSGRLFASLAGIPARPAAQRNLAIGSDNDPAERAADRTADAVMRMAGPAPRGAAPSHSTSPAETIRRKCPGCGEDEPIRRKPAALAAAAAPAAAPPAELGLGTGSPLPAADRSFFEPRFDRDLSSVRIHTDAAAGESARSIDARAYTIGSNIVFGSGEYRPETASGKHLIAHELAHVGQAEGGEVAASRISRVPRSSDDLQGAEPRYSFSDDCGWIDWGHVDPTFAKALINAVQKASGRMERKEIPQKAATYYQPKLTYEDGCPKSYDRGEKSKSKSDTGSLEIIHGGHGIGEYRLQGFEVGKADAARFDKFKDQVNEDLSKLLQEQKPPASAPFELYVRGYSDCLDSESTNKALREERAKAIADDFLRTGWATRGAKTSHRGAHVLNEFLDTNADRAGRRKNRGVIIEALPDYSVDPEDFETPYMETRFKKGPVDWALTRVKSMLTLKRSLRQDEVLGVALWIFMNQSVFFEKEQAWTEALGHSSFSEEDLPSNLIGFYMAALDIEPSQVRNTVGSICKVNDPTRSTVMFNMYRFQKNETFVPRGTNGMPGEFQAIVPLSPGQAMYELIGYEGSSSFDWFFEDAEGHRSER